MIMTNGLTFEEEMQAEINEARAKQRRVQETIKQAQETIKQAELEIKQYGDYADMMERTLQLRKNLLTVRHNGHMTSDVEHYLKQSTWDNLLTIMKSNNRILVVNDAVGFLVSMKFFADRDHARHTIYSTIYHHKKELDQVRKGIYQLRETGKAQQKDIRANLRNPISFERGIAKVLQDAHGEPLHRDEIWSRMQAIGVRSRSKDPIQWIDWNARQVHAERVAPHVWRWKYPILQTPKGHADSLSHVPVDVEFVPVGKKE